MGISTSKSHLERRNTVAKRSQRRTIHGLKSKVDKVFQDIKNFRGTEETEKYAELLKELKHIRNNLERRKNDLQPQVRNIYQTTWNELEEAYLTLDERVLENRERIRMKESEQQEKQKQKEEKSKKKKSEKFEEEDDIEITEDQEGDYYNDKYEEHEKSQLANSSEKRQTVELKFVQVIPETTVEAEIHSEVSSPKMKSEEEKRKSILKMGVPVLPGIVMPGIHKKISIVSPEDEPHHSNGNSTLLDRITDINEQLEAIEYQIADFVGKKNGTQYNRIKNTLTSYYHEISDMKTNDSYNLDQIRLCKNYIGSCLNFLDERSVDVIEVVEEKKVVLTEDIADKNTHQDNISSPVQNNALSQHEVSLKLQKLTKTTAI